MTDNEVGQCLMRWMCLSVLGWLHTGKRKSVTNDIMEDVEADNENTRDAVSTVSLEVMRFMAKGLRPGHCSYQEIS